MSERNKYLHLSLARKKQKRFEENNIIKDEQGRVLYILKEWKR